MASISEEDVKRWLAQYAVNNHLLEYLYGLNPTKVTEVESQLAIHEVNVILMETIDYQTIAEEANERGEYISRPVGPI